MVVDTLRPDFPEETRRKSGAAHVLGGNPHRSYRRLLPGSTNRTLDRRLVKRFLTANASAPSSPIVYGRAGGHGLPAGQADSKSSVPAIRLVSPRVRQEDTT